MAKKNKQPTETRIIFNEVGTSGLKAYSGFVEEAYNSQLYWPTCEPLYSRLWRSMPEIAMTKNAFVSWGRNIGVEVDLPDEPTDDDKAYQEFVQEVFDDMEGGATSFIETLVSRTPFYGFSYFSAPACIRKQDWKSPDEGDEWQSQYDDGRVGIRRLAFRDPSTFEGWDFDERKRVKGFNQHDYPLPAVTLPLNESLHITYGDPNNPEGVAGLEPVWRLERLKFGLEVVYGIGMEHAAGYLDVKKTIQGDLSANDKANIAKAAKSILSAQEGNYATWPFGIEGAVKDISFSAAPSLLEGIKHYSIMTLSVFMMQFIALNTLTGTGSFAAADDSSSMSVFTYNSMLDGFAAQLDAQIGRRLWEWNKASFPGATKRPKIRFSHVDKSVGLGDMGAFLQQTNGFLKLSDDDILAIRKRTGFLSQSLPEEPTVTPEEQAAKAAEEAARKVEQDAMEEKQVIEQALRLTSAARELAR